MSPDSLSAPARAPARRSGRNPVPQRYAVDVPASREPSPIQRARARRFAPLSRRARYWSAGRAGSFAAVAIVFAASARDQPRPSLIIVALLVAAYAVAWRLEFETATGVTVPNVLALVPMFVLLPPGLVPLAAVTGGLLGDLFAEQRWRRMLGTLVGGWSFVAPALLLAVVVPEPGWRGAPLYALAVALWVVTDAVGMYVQQRVVRRNVDARVANVLRMYAIEGPLALLAFLGALESDRFAYAFLAPFGVVFVFRELVSERRHRIEQQAELARAYHNTARLLGDMIEVDDRYTGLHSRGVVATALAVADALGLDPAERRRTELAALLHDVGKIRTPKEILHKAGPLSPAEWAIVREHPAEGARMLAEVGGYLADIGELVRHHHERFDGGGYPDGLAGDRIPLGSRIVCACDAFSAMTTDRSYRKALPVAAALSELERGAGTQFDPAVVRALVAVVRADEQERAAS